MTWEIDSGCLPLIAVIHPSGNETERTAMIRHSLLILAVATMGLTAVVTGHSSTALATSSGFTNIGVVVNNGVASYYLCFASSGPPQVGGLTINDPHGNQLHASLSYNNQTCTVGSSIVGYQVTATFSGLPSGGYAFRDAVALGPDGLPYGLTPGYAFIANAQGLTVATTCSVNFSINPDNPTGLQGCASNSGAYGNFNGPPPRPTNTPSPTNTPTTVPTNTPTLTPTSANTSTAIPTSAPTATPTSTATSLITSTLAETSTAIATAPAKVTPPPTSAPSTKGGVRQPQSASWSEHAFFAEGYTGRGYQEYLSLLNPRAQAAHARIEIYRMNGAARTLSIQIPALSRRTLDMNALAPRTSIALRVDAKTQIVAERALYHGNGSIVAGAPVPRRRWYIAESYVGAGFGDGLRIFNPGTTSAAVTITAYQGDGARRTSYRTIASDARINVSLDDIALTGGSAVVVQGTVPLVVESIVNTSRVSGPSSAMALASLSRTWYFPDGGTSLGNEEYVTVFNPQVQTAAVRLRPVTADGYQSPVTFHVKPHSRAVFVVQRLIRQAGMPVVIDADRPIAAQEVRYTSAGGLAMVDGAQQPGQVWGLADGYIGHGFKEWITLLNPSTSTAVIRVRVLGPHGIHTVTQRVAPHHRDYLYVGKVIPNGPVAAVVESTHAVVVGRTLIFNNGRGLSTTTGVLLRVR